MDLTRIKKNLTDNIADFIISQIRKLKTPTQECHRRGGHLPVDYWLCCVYIVPSHMI